MNERDIFLVAIEIADAQERATYVGRACGADAELRARVEELLQSHGQSSQFVETPPIETPALEGNVADTETFLVDPRSPRTGQKNDESAAEMASFLEPSTRDSWLGRLAHYEIEEILGRGAFGIVAKAFDEKLHRVVAIKMLSPELATTSPPRKRFLREARSTAAVPHENLVGIHAVEEEPIPYLVMEYIPGDTLKARLDQNGPLDVPDVLQIGKQIAAGMAAAHAANLIHRDIKPSNILLSDDRNAKVKISDFGMARAVDDASMTTSGMIAGTPMYMAPEQARGETLDHRADLFSLGSVLYQMTCGRPPFRASNTIAVLKRVCEDKPRPIYDVLPGTPEWLCGIIDRLLEKDRDNRFQTAQEVADLLARCESELQTQGHVTCVDSLNPQAKAQAETETVEATLATQRGSTVKRTGLFTGGLLAIAAMAIVLLVNGNRNPDDGLQSTDAESHTAGVAPEESLSSVVVASTSADNWALEFNGHSQYVTIPQLFPQQTADFTVEAWAVPRRVDPDGPMQGIVELSGKSSIHVSITSDGDLASTYVKDIWSNGKSPAAGVIGKSQLAESELCHVATVWDGDHLILFIDGHPVGAMETHLVPRMNDLPPFSLIGAMLGFDGRSLTVINHFNGIIDEVRISNVARYSEDFKPEKRFEPDEHTLALYHFDEGSGTVLKDSTDNGHNGAVHGAKWVPVDATLNVIEPSDTGWHGWPTDAPAPAIAPFDAQEAAQHQQAWADYLGVPVEYENSIGMNFRLIPPAEFLRGSTLKEIEAALQTAGQDEDWQKRISSEVPQHKVILTEPLYVGVTEVTQAQYEQVMGTNPSHFAVTGEGRDAVNDLETANHPVEMVSWNDAAEFCAKLSQQEHLKPFYFLSGATITPLDGTGYRLPTEAEWESACRAGTTTRFWSGNENSDLMRTGWFEDNSGGRTHAVGELEANPYQLSDIHGNVWEWVQDSWDPVTYEQFENTPAVNPHCPLSAGSQRVLRGGPWSFYPSSCRSSYRNTFPATYHDDDIGFRVVLSVDAVEKSSAASTSNDPRAEQDE